jgi:hypothetical protein
VLTEFDALVDMADMIYKDKLSESVSFKGAFVMYSILRKLPSMSLIRATSDIDLDVEDMEVLHYASDNLLRILNMSEKYKYVLIKERGFEKNPSGNSLTFEVSEGVSKVRVKIDMNIGRSEHRINYFPYGLNFIGNDVFDMLCDKLYVASTSKLPRRIKDLYDIYVYSHVMRTRLEHTVNMWGDRKITGPVYVLNEENYPDMKHAFEVHSEFKNKNFYEILHRVQNFSVVIYDAILNGLSERNKHAVW